MPATPLCEDAISWRGGPRSYRSTNIGPAKPQAKENCNQNPCPCKEGEFRAQGQATCKPWKECDEDSEYVSDEGTSTKDRSCELKECFCNFGTEANGSSCPTHGQEKCISCDNGRYLNGTACKACTQCDTTWQKQTQACGAATDTICDGITTTSTSHSYSWGTPGSWGECSKSCGGGERTRNLTCTKITNIITYN